MWTTRLSVPHGHTRCMKGPVASAVPALKLSGHFVGMHTSGLCPHLLPPCNTLFRTFQALKVPGSKIPMPWRSTALAADLSLMHAVSPAERLSQAGSGPSSSSDFWTKTRGAIASCRCPAICFIHASQAVSFAACPYAHQGACLS